MMKKYLIILLLSIKAADSIACQCIYSSISEEIGDADMILTGKVSRKANTYPVEYTFSIIETFKGILLDTVIIKTGTGGGDCGMIFKIGKSYLIYSKQHTTSRCHRNTLLENSSDVIKLRYIFNPSFSNDIGKDTSFNLNEKEASYFNAIHKRNGTNPFSFLNKRIAFFDKGIVMNKKTYFTNWGGKDTNEELLVFSSNEKSITNGFDAVIILNNKKRIKKGLRKSMIKKLTKTI